MPFLTRFVLCLFAPLALLASTTAAQVRPSGSIRAFFASERSDPPAASHLEKPHLLSIHIAAGDFIWLGAEARVPLGTSLALVAGLETNVTDQPICDQLLTANVYLSPAKGSLRGLVFGAGVGAHRCRESMATARMLNLSIGMRVPTRLPVLVSLRAHFKGEGAGAWNVTRNNLYLLTAGVPVL